MKKKRSWLLSLLLVLGGCSYYQPAVPEGYAGPVATIKDTAKRYSYSKADAFYLISVDGRLVENSRINLENSQPYPGRSEDEILVKRDVPATEITLELEGRTLYGMPIATILGTVYHVTGSVVFTPETGKTYLVKGRLSENYAALWIEEEITHEIVGEMVEKKGPTALDILEK